MNKKPTRKQFKQIVKLFKKRTGIKIRNSLKWYNYLLKRQATALLKSRGIQNVKEFMAERAVCLKVGKKKLIMHPGPLNAGRPVSALCMLTHENTHFIQMARWKLPVYLSKYLTKLGRMDIEVEACASEIPVRSHFGKYRRPRDRFTEHWGEIYNVGSDTVGYAKSEYIDREATMDVNDYKSVKIMLECIKEVMG